MQNTDNQQLLRETEVAEQLKISLATLRRWRSKGQGPIFLKLGMNAQGNPGIAVRYRLSDIDAWLASLENKPEAA